MGETSLFWLRVAVGLYSLGLLDAIITVLRGRESLFRVAHGAFGLGAILHLVSIVEQGVAAQRIPVDGVFESLSLGAWVVAMAFRGVYWKYKAESLSVFVFPLVFVMTLVAALRNAAGQAATSTPPEGWLDAHIVLALLAYAALLFTAAAAVAYLLQERQLKQKRQPGTSFYRLFPPLGTLDELISRSLGAGFVCITISIIIGSVWSYIKVGSQWIDSGLIVTAFITWGIYLAMIFFRVSAGWRGRKAAILAIVALCCSAMTWLAHAQLERHLLQ